jgi:hypothetical protein
VRIAVSGAPFRARNFFWLTHGKPGYLFSVLSQSFSCSSFVLGPFFGWYERTSRRLLSPFILLPSCKLPRSIRRVVACSWQAIRLKWGIHVTRAACGSASNALSKRQRVEWAPSEDEGRRPGRGRLRQGANRSLGQKVGHMSRVFQANFGHRKDDWSV